MPRGKPKDGTKNPGGRPSKLPSIDPARVEALGEAGLTDKQFAVVFQVTERTWNRWKKANEKFCQSLKKGKDAADHEVERALFRKATGYYKETEKVFCYEGEIVRAPTKTWYPEDTAACFIWLKNRKPELWSDTPIRPDMNRSLIMEWLDAIPPP